MNLLFIAFTAMLVVVVSSLEDRALDVNKIPVITFIGPDSNEEIQVKGIFGIQVKFTEPFTPFRMMIKGGNVNTIYCHGNTQDVITQASSAGAVDAQGFHNWLLNLESNSDVMTKLLARKPIHCYMVNLYGEFETPELVPFSVTYTISLERSSLSKPTDPMADLTILLNDSLKRQNTGISQSQIWLLAVGALIVVVVPIVLGIANVRRTFILRLSGDSMFV